MERTNCNIIMDLIPSYVDGICSKESAELVIRHTETCEKCKEKLEMLQKSVLTAEKPQQQIQYMKKVKKYYIQKNMICFLLLAGVIAAGLLLIFYRYGNISRKVYYVVSPLLIAASYIVLPRCEPKDRQGGKKQSGKISVMAVLELLMIVYIMALGGLCVYWAECGKHLFFVSEERLGPVIYWQLMVIVFILIGIFIYAGVRLFREKDVSMLIFNLAITGICMALGFISILRTLDLPGDFGSMIMKTFGVILMEGAFMHIVQQIKEKKIVNLYSS